MNSYYCDKSIYNIVYSYIYNTVYTAYNKVVTVQNSLRPVPSGNLSDRVGSG